MTDQELLERAARAAGYEPCRMSDDESALLLFGVQEPWNPLDDDGDAFQLMCSLGLMVNVADDICIVEAWFGVTADEPVKEAGRAAATRRAIVRAAAALGDEK